MNDIQDGGLRMFACSYCELWHGDAADCARHELTCPDRPAWADDARAAVAAATNTVNEVDEHNVN